MLGEVEVLWLTPDKPDNISVGRERISEHLESNGYNITLRGTTIKTILKSTHELNKYDIVIGTTRAGAVAAIWLKLIYRCPIIVDHIDPIRQFEKTHASWLSTLVRRMENLSFRVADRVLYVYKEEEDRINFFTENVRKTDLGVEADKFARPDSEMVYLAEDEIRDLNIEGKIAIYIGGLEPIYHIQELIAASSYLSSWSFLLIGDGSLREKVEEASIQSENIYYLGTIPHEQIPGYLKISDVGISLVDDPHTLKILEYGAAGLPVVQLAGRAESRFGDLLTYTERDPSQIAESIQSAEKHGPISDLHSFSTNFDWDRIADDYAETINNLI